MERDTLLHVNECTQSGVDGRVERILEKFGDQSCGSNELPLGLVLGLCVRESVEAVLRARLPEDFPVFVHGKDEALAILMDRLRPPSFVSTLKSNLIGLRCGKRVPPYVLPLTEKTILAEFNLSLRSSLRGEWPLQWTRNGFKDRRLDPSSSDRPIVPLVSVPRVSARGSILGLLNGSSTQY